MIYVTDQITTPELEAICLGYVSETCDTDNPCFDKPETIKLALAVWSSTTQDTLTEWLWTSMTDGSIVRFDPHNPRCCPISIWLQKQGFADVCVDPFDIHLNHTNYEYGSVECPDWMSNLQTVWMRYSQLHQPIPIDVAYNIVIGELPEWPIWMQ